MTVTQAAARLGISRRRVLALIQDGQLAVKRRVSTLFLVSQEAVERLAERRRLAAGGLPASGRRPKTPPEREVTT